MQIIHKIRHGNASLYIQSAVKITLTTFIYLVHHCPVEFGWCRPGSRVDLEAHLRLEEYPRIRPGLTREQVGDSWEDWHGTEGNECIKEPLYWSELPANLH